MFWDNSDPAGKLDTVRSTPAATAWPGTPASFLRGPQVCWKAASFWGRWSQHLVYVAEQDLVPGQTGLGVPEGADPIGKGTAVPMGCSWVFIHQHHPEDMAFVSPAALVMPHPSTLPTRKGAVAPWGEIRLRAEGLNPPCRGRPRPLPCLRGALTAPAWAEDQRCQDVLVRQPALGKRGGRARKERVTALGTYGLAVCREGQQPPHSLKSERRPSRVLAEQQISAGKCIEQHHFPLAPWSAREEEQRYCFSCQISALAKGVTLVYAAARGPREGALTPGDEEEAQHKGPQGTTAYVWCLLMFAVWCPWGQGSCISRQARQGEHPSPGSGIRHDSCWDGGWSQACGTAQPCLP